MNENSTNNIKVLIADDEVEFASTLVTRLQLRNFDTSMVTTGEEALKAVAKQQPDILLLDLKMPDLDGFEVLGRLENNYPNMKVIILTGHGSFDVGHEGMKLGAYDYLMKPIDLKLLTQKIEEAYEERNSG